MNYTLVLTGEEVQIVLGALEEIKYKTSKPIIDVILNQCYAQNEEIAKAKAEEEEGKDE